MPFPSALVAVSLGMVVMTGYVHAQTERFIRTPEQLLAMTSADVDDYLREAMGEKLPASAVDSLVVLAASRESLVLPKLAERLDAILQSPDEPGEVLTRLGGIVAYLGTPASMDVLLQLMALGPPNRIAGFLPMTLSYSAGRGNAFKLSYQAMDRGTESAKSSVLTWVKANVSKGQNLENWARALLARHAGHVTDFELYNDPIAENVDEATRDTLRLAINRERIKRLQQTPYDR